MPDLAGSKALGIEQAFRSLAAETVVAGRPAEIEYLGSPAPSLVLVRVDQKIKVVFCFSHIPFPGLGKTPRLFRTEGPVAARTGLGGCGVRAGTLTRRPLRGSFRAASPDHRGRSSSRHRRPAGTGRA